MITVTINDETHQFPQPLPLSELLKSLKIPLEGTAVAVNSSVVPRLNHGDVQIVGGEVLEIIRAVGGG